jgi:hypothetical protein
MLHQNRTDFVFEECVSLVIRTKGWQRDKEQTREGKRQSHDSRPHQQTEWVCGETSGGMTEAIPYYTPFSGANETGSLREL